jgi:hypothetical protein
MNNFENVFGCGWNEILRCAQDDRVPSLSSGEFLRCAQDDRSFLALLGMTKKDLNFLFERR